MTCLMLTRQSYHTRQPARLTQYLIHVCVVQAIPRQIFYLNCLVGVVKTRLLGPRFSTVVQFWRPKQWHSQNGIIPNPGKNLNNSTKCCFQNGAGRGLLLKKRIHSHREHILSIKSRPYDKGRNVWWSLALLQIWFSLSTCVTSAQRAIRLCPVPL